MLTPETLKNGTVLAEVATSFHSMLDWECRSNFGKRVKSGQNTHAHKTKNTYIYSPSITSSKSFDFCSFVSDQN